MSYLPQPENRLGGNTIASYFGAIGPSARVNFDNFAARYTTASGLGDIELATLVGNESVIVLSTTNWNGGILNYDGGPSAFGVNVPLTPRFIVIGDPDVTIPHAEWRTYDICSVNRADSRWYRLQVIASNSNNLVRLSVQVMGDTANTPIRQSRNVPYTSAQTGTQILSTPLAFRYETNAIGGHIQVSSATGAPYLGLWYTSSSNGIGFSGATQIEGALDVAVPATGWVTLGGNAPVASSKRRVQMTLVGPQGLWELTLADNNGGGVILVVDRVS